MGLLAARLGAMTFTRALGYAKHPLSVMPAFAYARFRRRTLSQIHAFAHKRFHTRTLSQTISSQLRKYNSWEATVRIYQKRLYILDCQVLLGVLMDFIRGGG